MVFSKISNGVVPLSNCILEDPQSSVLLRQMEFPFALGQLRKGPRGQLNNSVAPGRKGSSRDTIHIFLS